MPKRVLFVCTGNICRSPMAEGMMRYLVAELGAEVEVFSAGTSAPDGMPPSRNSVTAMEEEGIDISMQTSSMLTADMVDDATHIFGMSRDHVRILRHYFPESTEKLFVLREFIADETVDIDVFDPIGGSLDDYRLARNLIKEAMPSVIELVTAGRPDGLDVEELA